MGTGLYAASKAIAVSDLIATVTPEKRTEERRTEQGTENNHETHGDYIPDCPPHPPHPPSLVLCHCLLVEEVLVLQEMWEKMEEEREEEQKEEEQREEEEERQEEQREEEETREVSLQSPQKQDTKVTHTPVLLPHL